LFFLTIPLSKSTHFPYTRSSDLPVIDLLREAAMDPEVRSIYITIYRMAENSKIANALINAARNGKDVTIMLELRARFDEEHNIRSEEHTSELQSRENLVCRLLLE